MALENGATLAESHTFLGPKSHGNTTASSLPSLLLWEATGQPVDNMTVKSPSGAAMITKRLGEKPTEHLKGEGIPMWMEALTGLSGPEPGSEDGFDGKRRLVSLLPQAQCPGIPRNINTQETQVFAAS